MASTYTHDQVLRFLSLIELPQKYHPIDAENPPRDINFLCALHTHMISTVPYENLKLHYSTEHAASLEPTDLLQKIVLDARGRGGYCLENSLFYMHMLRGLGFSTYTPGVRIRLRTDGVPQGEFISWVHIVNIVTLSDGSKWMVDVGFGGDGATKPIPLVPGHVTRNIGTQDIRLIYDWIPGLVDRSPDKKLWIYQYRNGPEMEWNSFYAFPELEFLQNDFEQMRWWIDRNPESFQTTSMLVVKFLRRRSEAIAGEEEIYGKRMLINGTVKENLGGKTNIVEQCESEAQRVQALKEWFGISLTEEEKKGIRRWVTELKPSTGD